MRLNQAFPKQTETGKSATEQRAFHLMEEGVSKSAFASCIITQRISLSFFKLIKHDTVNLFSWQTWRIWRRKSHICHRTSEITLKKTGLNVGISSFVLQSLEMRSVLNNKMLTFWGCPTSWVPSPEWCIWGPSLSTSRSRGSGQCWDAAGTSAFPPPRWNAAAPPWSAYGSAEKSHTCVSVFHSLKCFLQMETKHWQLHSSRASRSSTKAA